MKNDNKKSKYKNILLGFFFIGKIMIRYKAHNRTFPAVTDIACRLFFDSINANHSIEMLTWVFFGLKKIQAREAIQ